MQRFGQHNRNAYFCSENCAQSRVVKNPLRKDTPGNFPVLQTHIVNIQPLIHRMKKFCALLALLHPALQRCPAQTQQLVVGLSGNGYVTRQHDGAQHHRPRHCPTAPPICSKHLLLPAPAHLANLALRQGHSDIKVSYGKKSFRRISVPTTSPKCPLADHTWQARLCTHRPARNFETNRQLRRSEATCVDDVTPATM